MHFSIGCNVGSRRKKCEREREVTILLHIQMLGEGKALGYWRQLYKKCVSLKGHCTTRLLDPKEDVTAELGTLY